MDGITLEEIKKRSVRGVLTLTTRTFILQVITFVSTFILTILLAPSVFGVFFVVSAVISFLNYFSDIGLAAALIQKKEEVTREDLVTTFTIQQFLVGGLVILTLFFSRSIISFYNLDISGLWLFRALAISFFLSSLKTIPSIILERRLEFNRLVIPQIVETFFFYLVAVVLAVKGFGITSFTWAALARGVSGLLTIYILAPWVPSLGIYRESAKKLLSFGVPFQLNSLLALAKDDLLTVFLGKILPLSQVGFIGWAKKWAETPLRLIMDNVIRVTFPAYSRLQEEPATLAKAIEKSIFFLAVLIFPLSCGLVIFIRPLVFIIPKYLKWEPAIFSLYLFSISAILASFSSPLVNALNAIGKIKISLGLMMMWLILTWLLVPALVFKIGFEGVAWGAVIISGTVLVTILVAKRYMSFNFLPQIIKPFLATVGLALVAEFSLYLLGQSLWAVGASILLSGAVYLVLIFLLSGQEILPYVKKFLHGQI